MKCYAISVWNLVFGNLRGTCNWCSIFPLKAWHLKKMVSFLQIWQVGKVLLLDLFMLSMCFWKRLLIRRSACGIRFHCTCDVRLVTPSQLSTPCACGNKGQLISPRLRWIGVSKWPRVHLKNQVTVSCIKGCTNWSSYLGNLALTSRICISKLCIASLSFANWVSTHSAPKQWRRTRRFTVRFPLLQVPLKIKTTVACEHKCCCSAQALFYAWCKRSDSWLYRLDVWKTSGPELCTDIIQIKWYPKHNQDIQTQKAGVVNWLIERGGEFKGTTSKATERWSIGDGGGNTETRRKLEAKTATDRYELPGPTCEQLCTSTWHVHSAASFASTSPQNINYISMW